MRILSIIIEEIKAESSLVRVGWGVCWRLLERERGVCVAAAPRVALPPKAICNAALKTGPSQELNMKITVRTLTHRLLELEVHCDDTIRSIKERVVDNEGQPYSVIRFICDGKELDDDHRTLRECNVTDGSLLFLILHTKISKSRHKNILVNVVTPSGDTIALQASRCTTVSTIKSILWSELNARAVAPAAVADVRFSSCSASTEATDAGIKKNTHFNAASPSDDAFSHSPVLFYAGMMLEDGCVLSDITTPQDCVLQLLMSPSQSDLSLDLMRSPPKTLDVLGQPLGTTGCQRLADALLLNTSITSLTLHCSEVGAAGSSVLFPALAHLPSLALLCLSGTRLQSAGALHLCSALPHLTALTELDVGYNELSADDAARICSAAASAGLTRLKALDLSGNAAAVPCLITQCSLSALTTVQELRFNGM